MRCRNNLEMQESAAALLCFLPPQIKAMIDYDGIIETQLLRTRALQRPAP